MLIVGALDSPETTIREATAKDQRASVAVRKFAQVLSLRRSELPNQSDTSNLVTPVSLLNPKFAMVIAERPCELRVRDTGGMAPT